MICGVILAVIEEKGGAIKEGLRQMGVPGLGVFVAGEGGFVGGRSESGGAEEVGVGLGLRWCRRSA